MIFVSIAISFYNAEEFLPDAIRSVFAQTHQNWELVLIDDGSTDRSLEIARSVIDSRVRVISDGKNKKLAGRLNQFIDIAKYDYILRMDADDLMLPDRIEKLLEIISANNVDIVTSGIYSVLNNLEIVGIRGSSYNSVTFHQILNRKIGITHAALIAKKSWYERNRYDETLSIAQDVDLWFRSSKKNDLKIISIEDPLYIYREENNVTIHKMLRAYKNERMMIRKYGETMINIVILRSYLKSFTVKILHGLGKLDILQKNRSQNVLTEEQKNRFNSAIMKIQSTPVKGLNA